MTSNLPQSSFWTPVATWNATKQFDIVVIGGGIAGLAFTLRLPIHLSVALVTKGVLGESNTRYAQGGLAAAVGPRDDPELHFQDTITSGAGLCDPAAVRALVEDGPDAVAWLLEQGTHFDRENDQLALGLEAAHSRHRVLHAGGDATGAEIERSLVQQVISRPNVIVFERATAIDLLRVHDNANPDRIGGALVLLHNHTEPTCLASPVTVLANGGAGQLWAVTSNPLGATGDGIAMALRAGADVADLEFTQFHPTVFCAPGAEPFLMTEAIRGEGAFLRSASGDRFMPGQHPLAELAPRDVVARAVQRQIALDDADSVSLDLRHLEPGHIRRRFPTIAEHLARYNIDLTKDLIPVAPAAHYFIGGIVAGADGSTSLPGLLAIGEVSCTGVHGANRLASNSLLEGLVFGLTAADAISDMPSTANWQQQQERQPPVVNVTTRSDTTLLRSRLQRTMSDAVAVVRSIESLEAARADIDHYTQNAELSLSVESIELRNMLLLAGEVVESAIVRKESRGAHYRSDFPESDPMLAERHLIIHRTRDPLTRSFGALNASLGALAVTS